MLTLRELAEIPVKARPHPPLCEDSATCEPSPSAHGGVRSPGSCPLHTEAAISVPSSHLHVYQANGNREFSADEKPVNTYCTAGEALQRLSQPLDPTHIRKQIPPFLQGDTV